MDRPLFRGYRYGEYGFGNRTSKSTLYWPQSELGRKLAEMHKAGKSDKGFGFDVNNTIGR